MKALLLTNEYPPYIYGGAGVHIDYLSRELAKIMEVEVRSFGDQETDLPNLKVRGFGVNTAIFSCPKNLNSVFGAIRRGIDFNTVGVDADVVHCHTWYTHFGAILAKINYGIPMVLTVHSLEPLRPWKREQLGYGYDCSSWVERTAIEMADAVIAVSEETKRDVLRLFNIDENHIRIIYNGIDPEEYYPRSSRDHLAKNGVNPDQPYILFVGRIARQKGIIHLVNAIKYMDPGFQVVLCAGAPDTPEIAEEMKQAVAAAQRSHRPGIIWIEKMVTKDVVYELFYTVTLQSLFARRFTSRSESSIWRPWRARRLWLPRQLAGLRKSLLMARPVTWCRWSRCWRALSNRWIPTSFRAIWLNESID
jgi:starch synthase